MSKSRPTRKDNKSPKASAKRAKNDRAAKDAARKLADWKKGGSHD